MMRPLKLWQAIPAMKSDPYGTREDAIYDMIACTEKQMHSIGECDLAPRCVFCLEELEERQAIHDSGDCKGLEGCELCRKARITRRWAVGG